MRRSGCLLACRASAAAKWVIAIKGTLAAAAGLDSTGAAGAGFVSVLLWILGNFTYSSLRGLSYAGFFPDFATYFTPEERGCSSGSP